MSEKNIDNSPKLRLAVAGVGTVGGALFEQLIKKTDLIAKRCGYILQISHVAVRNPNKSRPVSFDGIRLWDDANEMAQKADCDIFIELMGGEKGIALASVKAALARKIPVVTANKAMMALHGLELAELAENNGVALKFEASVAGGIPIIKALREGLAANQIEAIFGILNGTCNYILTQMREDGQDFEIALKDAQEKGYAEADPTFDIDGIDSAHKLALLSALAFGVAPDFAAINITGIRNIQKIDIEYAAELGHQIKLLGLAKKLPNGKIIQTVSPMLASNHAPIAAIDGVFNGVVVKGDAVGDSLYEGEGAGGHPTASAVIADLMDIAASGNDLRNCKIFGVAHDQLDSVLSADLSEVFSAWYVRFMVRDQPGVIASITSILSDHHISLNSIVQRGDEEEKIVNLVLRTHKASTQNIATAIAKINQLSVVSEPATLYQIMDD